MSIEMGPQTIHRFHRMEAARLVAEAMRPITDATISAQHIPVPESDAQRGVGDYVVCYESGGEYIPSDRTYRMSRCADMGIQLALADALRKVDPLHPLLSTWHLKPETATN